MQDVIFVGVAGGSGSGKTTVAHNLVNAFSEHEVALVQQDSYYQELKNTTIEERNMVNFDHPDSIEFSLLAQHLKDLKSGNIINKPIYDFTTHLRKEDTTLVKPKKVIIIEGILVLSVPEIREMMDIKVFVDTDVDEMLLRRIERDINERERTFQSVKNQYLRTVKPMYLEFCEPSKRYADIIIPRGGENKIAVNMLIAKLKRIINNECLDN